jgi:predicted nucleotidyltransferase
MKIDDNVQGIAEALASLDGTMAVVLGGSRAQGLDDADSDYDLYVYHEGEASDERRREILQPFVTGAEIGNRFWETEDDCVMRSGVPLDIIYRDVKGTEESLRRTVTEGIPSAGYTTCIWHNVISSRILCDQTGWFRELQMHYSVPYPDTLRKNIISHNRVLLSGSLASYDRQIEKAEKRRDIVSINHRTAAFLASYFDIIFAMNRITHPGEKRLVTYCLQNCAALPDDFENNIKSLTGSSGEKAETVSRMIRLLDEALVRSL